MCKSMRWIDNSIAERSDSRKVADEVIKQLVPQLGLVQVGGVAGAWQNLATETIFRCVMCEGKI